MSRNDSDIEALDPNPHADDSAAESALRPTRLADFNGQPCGLKHAPNGPTGGIDRGGIFQWLRRYFLQFGESELFGGLRAFGCVATVAGQR